MAPAPNMPQRMYRWEFAAEYVFFFFLLAQLFLRGELAHSISTSELLIILST